MKRNPFLPLFAMMIVILCFTGLSTAKDKATLCHIDPDDPTEWYTIEVNSNVEDKYIDEYGDRPGPCTDYLGEVLCHDNDKYTITECGLEHGECKVESVDCDDLDPSTFDLCEPFVGCQNPTRCGESGFWDSDTGHCDYCNIDVMIEVVNLLRNAIVHYKDIINNLESGTCIPPTVQCEGQGQNTTIELLYSCSQTSDEMMFLSLVNFEVDDTNNTTPLWEINYHDLSISFQEGTMHEAPVYEVLRRKQTDTFDDIVLKKCYRWAAAEISRITGHTCFVD